MSSATNISSPDAENTSNAANASRNPVALEVLVTVNGTRAGSADTRELFTEDAKTVLVFPDGAVIRLAAVVSSGQLLFVTDKRSGQEVVCQVLQTQPCGDTLSYVNLRFTEPKPDFWDVAFPSGPRREAEFTIKEHVEAEALTRAETAAPIEPHKAEDVELLRKEVEALRKQLFDSRDNPPAPPQETAAASDAPLMPTAKDSGEHAPMRPVIGMSLPIRVPSGAAPGAQRRASSADDPSDALLPKPALDFSQIPANAPASPAGFGLIRRHRTFDFQKLLLPAAGLVVVILVVGLWLAKPWKYFSSRKPATAAAFSPTATPRTGTVPAPDIANSSAVTSPSEDASASREEAASPKRNDSERSAKRSPALPVKPAVSKKTNAGSSAPATKDLDIPLPDAPVVPPKLLRSVNPVYPPDAMRNFITGDVRAVVLVQTNGHVGEVKILSGPKAFHEAAIAALNQYEYSPATQANRPVPCQVNVTVKFWFDP